MKLLITILLCMASAVFGVPADRSAQIEEQAATKPDSTASTTRAASVPQPALVDVDLRTTMPGFSTSAHDFFGPSAPMERRCAPCHAPAPEIQPTAWDPDAARRRIDAIPSVIAGSSLQCLTCHDGTIASEIIGGGSDPGLSAFASFVNPRRDHPVGVEYPPAGRRSGRLRRNYESPAKLAAQGRIKLPEGRVECISCHEPHNAFGYPDMLVMSNRQSALCLSCHRL